MDPIERFARAQEAVLERCGLEAEPRMVTLPSIGEAQVLAAGSGPPLLFVIGGGAPGALWAPLAAALPGYRRLIVDRPAFGLTRAVPHRREGMRTLARTFLTEALDALQLERTVVIANSMGAWWATQLALAAPERVEAMVHVGCPALLLDTSAPPPMRLIGLRGVGTPLVRLQGSSTKAARRTFAMMRDPLGDDPRGQALAELMACTAGLPDYARTWADLLHAFIRPRGARPGMSITTTDLARLELPLRYVWGSADPFGGPEVGRRAARAAPDAELVEVPGGHVPWVRDPDAVAEPIRGFLERHGLASQRSIPAERGDREAPAER